MLNMLVKIQFDKNHQRSLTAVRRGAAMKRKKKLN